MKNILYKISNKKEFFYISLLILIFFIGIFLRIKYFIAGFPLWHDECSLALNIINRSIYEYFKPLEHFQCAPFIFLILTKLTTNILGINEHTLKSIPFICSLLSILMFYFLSKDFLKTKWSILIANFLFAINYKLIQYSQEFKQYSSDVLFIIITLYFLSKIEINNLTTKQIILLSLFFIIASLISFSSVFVIIPYILIQIFKYKRTILKKLCILLSCPLIVAIMYYFAIFIPSHASQISLDFYLWKYGFLTFNPSIILANFKTNYNFFFFPNNKSLLILILSIIGLIKIFQRKDTLSKLILGTILTAICFSFLKIYPLIERTCLYLIPIIILIISNLFSQKLQNKKIFFIFIFFITLLYFQEYNLAYYKNILNTNIFITEDAKTPMSVIKNNYNENEYVVYNIASDSEYEFYTKYYNFTPNHFAKINTTNYNKKDLAIIFNQLPKNNTYWFYFPFEYGKNPVIAALKSWANKKNILFEQTYYKSYLLKIKL